MSGGVPAIRAAIGLGLASTIAAIGWLDYETGPQLGLSLLYLIPLTATGWLVGARFGAANAVLAAGAWFAADIAWYPAEHLWISGWNAFTRLVIYLFLALATARLRVDRERLAALLALEQALARTDALTGLANARAFREGVNDELPRLLRRGAGLCVIYLDIDNFKRVNDRYGHEAGDELLRRIGAVIRQSIRAGDLAARLGGDEFGLALFDTTGASAKAMAGRVVEGIRALASEYPGTDLGASAGVARFDVAPESVEEAVRLADQAMYTAKAAGTGSLRILTAAPPEKG